MFDKKNCLDNHFNNKDKSEYHNNPSDNFPSLSTRAFIS